jgi:hypothetical protein
MRLLSALRASLIALTATVATIVIAAPAAQAASGTIRISVVKGGWIIGASGGSGVMNFQGRRYPLSIGGLSYGLTFGARRPTWSAASPTSAGRRMWPACTARRAPASRSAAARRRSFCATRRARR